MMYSMRARALSLTAASGLAALALLAALTMRISFLSEPPKTSDQAWEVFTVEPPKPPPPLPVVHPPAAAPPIESDIPDPIEQSAQTEALTPSDLVPIASPEPAFATITDPHWLHYPSNLERLYPRRALQRGIEGETRLDCVVGLDGWLSRCVVVSETPSGWGFGEAALRIAREYQMSPARRNGEPVEARYRMVVPFRLR